jgi:sporulation protein YlmC with PRC-barrel domain
METGGRAKDVPVGADVECADGLCGVCTAVVVEPHSEAVTHIVVRERDFPHQQRLVPLERVAATNPARIRLDCRADELGTMPEFVETEYVPGALPYMLWPMGIPEPGPVILEHERVPDGELAVHRGAHVEATDGAVGRVEEFLVDPASGRITHLVLREGRLWGQKDVTVPVTAIGRLAEDTIYLTLDRRAVADLPAVPVRRKAAAR